ncbi:hypothetical protein Nepgr_000945 [Nepenthes gracilis]|uniref:Uncharacterized protein n=1 Tax=Nepenthes gracilis TaxID=150966 RepID=A0AAD3RWY5_NEPGR|nr:hypothetical protein Nepgr_000945 [Nepenthes gracilis]
MKHANFQRVVLASWTFNGNGVLMFSIVAKLRNVRVGLKWRNQLLFTLTSSSWSSLLEKRNNCCIRGLTMLDGSIAASDLEFYDETLLYFCKFLGLAQPTGITVTNLWLFITESILDESLSSLSNVFTVEEIYSIVFRMGDSHA